MMLIYLMHPVIYVRYLTRPDMHDDVPDVSDDVPEMHDDVPEMHDDVPEMHDDVPDVLMNLLYMYI